MKILSYFRLLSFLGMMLFIPVLYAAPVIQKDRGMVGSLFSRTKPQCIGIYVVDVPESLNNSTKTSSYDDFKIESKFIYPPAFKQQVRLREQALNDAINSPGNDPENAPFIKEIIRLPGDRGVIFDRSQPGSDDAYRTLEAHIHVDHIAFTITSDILDLSADKYVDERKSYSNAGFSRSKMNQKPAKLAAMQSLISRLSGRLDHEIPSGKGVCIPNGFIADDGGKHEVVIGFDYDSSDFSVGFNTNNKLIADGDTFFGRSKDIEAALKGAEMKTLKKYALTRNGIPTEAWLFVSEESENQSQQRDYDFNLYANEAVASAEKPLMVIEFNNEDKQTRYSEAQMLDIWERITGTLRYRENAL